MDAVLEKFLLTKNGFREEELLQVASCFSPVTTSRNELLLSYNQVCRHYYFIKKGCIRLFTTSADGTEHARYFAFEGSFATALPSFIDQQPAEEFMETPEASQLLRITRTDFYLSLAQVSDLLPTVTKSNYQYS